MMCMSHEYQDIQSPYLDYMIITGLYAIAPVHYLSGTGTPIKTRRCNLDVVRVWYRGMPTPGGSRD